MNNMRQLRKAMIIVGFVAIVASSFLSISGFILADQYKNAIEFMPLNKPDIHVFPMIAARYAFLAVIFLLYVAFNWRKGNSIWQFVTSFPLIFLTIFVAVRMILDSGSLPNLGTEYAILTFLVDKGGVCILILSGVLFVLSGVAFFRLIRKKNFP